MLDSLLVWLWLSCCLCVRIIVRFFGVRFLGLVTELEDFLDLEVSKIHLRILNDYVKLLQLIVLAKTQQVVDKDVDGPAKDQSCHEVLQLLVVYP